MVLYTFDEWRWRFRTFFTSRSQGWRATGLCHVAIPYPTRADLGDALRWLVAAGIPLDGASDHGTTVIDEVLVLSDPDDNGVEMYWDRPMEDWPRTPDGGLAMFSKALNVQALLAASPSPHFPSHSRT